MAITAKAKAKSILMVSMGDRKDTASSVQQVFTDFGCIIRTRIGLHDGVGDDACSNQGLILLELVGDLTQQKKLSSQLRGIKGVRTKLVSARF